MEGNGKRHRGILGRKIREDFGKGRFYFSFYLRTNTERTQREIEATRETEREREENGFSLDR